jgi:hypothetical protein
MSKKLEQKQARREAEERKRRELRSAARKRNLITLVVVGLVGALVVFLIYQERDSTNVTSDFGVSAAEAGCDDVETHDAAGRDHVDEGEDIQYETTPPSSGPHFAQWADFGFSAEAIPEENLVHNLEHGQIVIWYSPDAPQDVVDDLETYVDDAGQPLLAAPYDQVPDGFTFSLSAWGATQNCEDVSGQVIAEFRQRFQGRGPEQVGIPTFEG